MTQTLRCLLTAVFLLSVAVGLEYVGGVEVPGLDVAELGLEPRPSTASMEWDLRGRPPLDPR